MPSDLRFQRFLEEKSRPRDVRTPTQIDRDRILYSTNFARLAEVTQVVSADHGYVFHNRLTHSLKVAQLARRIAERLRQKQKKAASDLGLDVDAAEAAALAHDLGHPPFGHIAEDELNKRIKAICKDDGYEGNAQSFRIVTKLAIGDPIDSDGIAIDEGLNLTRATLNGILKYPWKFSDRKRKTKWGAYPTETEEFEWVRGSSLPTGRGLEAEIMDWSDDITYAVHDLFDFYCAGKIPLERLCMGESDEMRAFVRSYVIRNNVDRADFDKHFKALLRFFERFRKSIGRRYCGTRAEQRNIWGRMTSLITEYVGALSIDATGKTSLVSITEEAREEVEIAKELTWYYVILENDLATSQHGQEHVVGELFDLLYEASSSKKKRKLFPPLYEEQLKRVSTDHGRIRLVADCVSGMTEKEIITLYRKLHGIEHGRMIR